MKIPLGFKLQSDTLNEGFIVFKLQLIPDNVDAPIVSFPVASTQESMSFHCALQGTIKCYTSSIKVFQWGTIALVRACTCLKTKAAGITLMGACTCLRTKAAGIFLHQSSKLHLQSMLHILKYLIIGDTCTVLQLSGGHLMTFSYPWLLWNVFRGNG